MKEKKHKPRFILGFECIAQKYSANAGYVFGKIYNLELNGAYNEFRGSISWLAKRVGLSYNATFRIIKQLEFDDLIVDTTPESIKNNKTQVRHYITNPYKLLELSLEMDEIVDEEINKTRIDNEEKKKILVEKMKIKGKELPQLIEISDIISGDYPENPFDEID